MVSSINNKILVNTIEGSLLVDKIAYINFIQSLPNTVSESFTICMNVPTKIDTNCFGVNYVDCIKLKFSINSIKYDDKLMWDLNTLKIQEISI